MDDGCGNLGGDEHAAPGSSASAEPEVPGPSIEVPGPARKARRACDLVVVLLGPGQQQGEDLRLLHHAVGHQAPVRPARSAPGARALIEAVRCRHPVVVAPVDGRHPDAADRLRTEVAALAPTPVVALVAPGDAAAVDAAVGGGARDYVARHFSPDQVARALSLADGASPRRDQLRHADRLWRAVVSRTSDAVFVLSSGGGFRALTPACAQLFSGGSFPVTVADVLGPVHPADRRALDAAFAGWRRGAGDPVVVRRSVAGGWRSYEAVGVDLRGDPAVGGLVVTVRDITEAVAARSRARSATGIDPLTGLPARRHFAQTLSVAAASGTPVLVMMDVDGMTAVNDRFGHQAGDDLLRTVAQRLVASLPLASVASRVSGDEFAVLVPDPPPGTSAEELARTLVAAVADGDGAARTADAQQAPSAAVAAGVAVGGDVDGGQLFAHADQALAVARRRGPHSVVRFDSVLAARGIERRRLRADLRGAASRGELELRYQPVQRLADDALVGFEALVRWRHPELGLLAPDRFVGLGEESGAIVDVDTWVLRQACTQLAEWSRRRPDLPIGMAVNVSARQLVDPGFATSVSEVLDAIDVVPAHLCLEVTERAVVEDLDAAATALRAVRTTGVRIAIDDFGIGFASLAYLQRFPADHIKVDRSFVAGVGTDPVDTTLVDTIMVMADRLGMAVVAEGVETSGQRAELLRMGCPFAQGFLWGQPLGRHQATAAVDGAPPATRWDRPWVAPGTRATDRTGQVAAPAGTAPGLTPGAVAGSGEPADGVAAFLGHELRTPIHVIGSYTELLRVQLAGGDGEAADTRAALDAIDRQVAHLEHVVTSLRDARALDQGTLVLNRRRVDVGALARALASDLAGEVPDHLLRVTVAAGTPAVPADAGRLAQILTNLLVNAAKFSPPGTAVDVDVSPAAGGVRVTVVDRGPGIALSAAPAAFQPFVSLDQRRRGSGLGLYLARGFAQAHGGDLTYRRATTGGAELCLFLPGGADDAPAAARDVDGGTAGPASQDRAAEQATGALRAATTDADVAGAPAHTADVAGTPAHAAEAGRVPLGIPLPPPVDRDGEALRVLAAAQQAMAAAGDRTDLSRVLHRVVADLGGQVVGEAHPAPDEVVPVDLSLGSRPARFAAAEGLSAARLRLDALLPVLADFARSLGPRLPG